MTGIVNINKPKGKSSHFVVAVIRRITDADKRKLFKSEEMDEEAWQDIVNRGFAE